ncbi:hypothetical protein [Mesorhizobium sp. M2A.F.Ca.ET.043.05.1.1]|uniref:hypothetical protein n=1 Tax=Mesorhizobium sp. M2A.F.Ca.ET.043.05.1.1 TaxID=2493671 RepID=UPI001FE03193|nr:hypothetical protein [Mesorhizobium sp. M2A.F.Ca.ET.043.05.1.1]
MSAHTAAMSEHEYREAKFFQTFGSVPTPAFHDPEEQTRVWGAHGVASTMSASCARC